MKKFAAFVFTIFITFTIFSYVNNGSATDNATAVPPSSESISPSETPKDLLIETDAVPKTPAVENVRVTYSTPTPAPVIIPEVKAEISAANAFMINADTGSTLYAKNSNELIAPASTTKMLTALTVLDFFTIDEVITVGHEIEMIGVDSSRAWLTVGDKLTVKQLLTAMLLPSGNDAAFTFAVNAGKRIAGDDGMEDGAAVEVFVEEMNKKATEVGAISSHFATPDGYDADGQHTTAYDLAQIAKACLKNETLCEIMGSITISDTWASGQEVTYHNTNELINPESPFYYPNAIGLKTGSTANAGDGVVSAAAINGKTYICVVMCAVKEERYWDTLLLYGEIE